MKYVKLGTGAYFRLDIGDTYAAVLQKVPFHLEGSSIPSNAIDTASGMHLLVDAATPVEPVDEPENPAVRWDGVHPDLVTEPLNLVRREQGEPDGTK